MVLRLFASDDLGRGKVDRTKLGRVSIHCVADQMRVATALPAADATRTLLEVRSHMDVILDDLICYKLQRLLRRIHKTAACSHQDDQVEFVSCFKLLEQ